MTIDIFRLDKKIAVITGGAGLLGQKHAEAIASVGGRPILLDIDANKLKKAKDRIKLQSGYDVDCFNVDITDGESLRNCSATIHNNIGEVDILINNASMTVESNAGDTGYFAPFPEYPINYWNKAIQVGLTGTFLCSQVFGSLMAKKNSGVILNIASDVGVISPDHRIYKPEGEYPGVAFNTPISYVAIKAGLIGMTRYLATYWAKEGVRVNALSPAGVYNGHDERFVKRLTNLIPMGRMATQDEYKGAIVFLCSEASKFMTGFNLIMDGGRTAW